jgi:alpha-D-ribose 1-methylphosphonate 5-phosphate C-P lyase
MDYAKMWVSLYEAYVQYGALMDGAGYPVMVNGRYIMSPSPIPRWDVPNLNQSDCIYLFGAGREKRIYAVPPYTPVESLGFEDHPFKVQRWDHPCELCGSNESFLDEVLVDDQGGRIFVCSDSDYCGKRQAASTEGGTP